MVYSYDLTLLFGIPLISYIMKNSKIVFHIMMSLVLCYFLYNGYRIFNGIKFPSTTGVSYFCYIFYILGGYYIAQNKFLEKFKSIIIFIVLLFSIIILFYTIKQYDYFLWYDNPFILLLSFSLLILFYRWIKDLRLERWKCITDLSNMTFGIYLLHMIFVNSVQLYTFEYIKNCNSDILIYILTLLILFCSVLTMKLIKNVIIEFPIGYSDINFNNTIYEEIIISDNVN